MIKISNHNIAKHGTRATDLGVMIGRCSLDSQHGRPDVILRMLAALFSGTRMTTLRTTTIREHNARHGLWKTTVLHCYFRSNPSQSGYKKRMIEIWQECVGFQTTSQRLADQVRTIIKKGWFSDLEV